MNYLSVCSGIEAATVAWHPLGWNPVGFADIEKFPSEVLRHHYPNVTNFGDMTKYKEWNLGTVDLLVGGTPCQSFSVAGLRKGLEDPRGNLALVYCGILDHFRPKWFVWENVPGVLSSGGGRDFGSFLGAVAELGYGFAYRVLDAQYFGVAQRRRRVFVVGCLGDWRRAAEVLFEPDSLRRDNPPSRKKGQASTAGASSSVDANGLQLTVGTLCADTHPGAYSGQDAYTGRLVPQIVGALTAKGPTAMGAPEVDAQHYIPMVHTMTPVGVPEVMATLCSSTAGISRPGNATTEHETYIPMAPVPYRKSKRAQSSEDDETWVDGEVSNTINLFDQGDIRTTHAVVQPIALAENTIGRQPENGGNGNGFTVGGPMYTLNATGVHGVAQPIAFSAKDYGGDATTDLSPTLRAGNSDESHANSGNWMAVAQPVAFSSNMSVPDCQTDVSPTLKLGGHGGGNPPAVAQPVGFTRCDHGGDAVVDGTPTMRCGSNYSAHLAAAIPNMAVRRLTPVECERLQGFPDNYTNIPWRKSAESPDGPRYKALGNSMAVPVMAWIGRRIQEVEAR